MAFVSGFNHLPGRLGRVNIFLITPLPIFQSIATLSAILSHLLCRFRDLSHRVAVISKIDDKTMHFNRQDNDDRLSYHPAP